MDGNKPSIQKSVEKKNASSMKLCDTSRDEFVAHITENKADSFAKTFVAKADMQAIWDNCIGCWDTNELMGAIITTQIKAHSLCL